MSKTKQPDILKNFTQILVGLGVLFLCLFLPTIIFLAKGNQVAAAVTGTLTVGTLFAISHTGAFAAGTLYSRAAMREGADIALRSQETNDRWDERNAYRRALIQAARARRSREGLRDRVVFEVREAYRRLERGRSSYQIQADGVRLAERRVESTDLLLEAGKANTRARLEAQDDLVRAQNALTLALVDYAVARLELERDTGILQVRSNATWVPRPEGEDLGPPPAGTSPDPLASSPAADCVDPPPPPPSDPVSEPCPPASAASDP